MTRLAEYRAFLEAKRPRARVYGQRIEASAIHRICKDFQAAIIAWAVLGGRRAIFARFGLGKTIMQLEVIRLVLEQSGGLGLIVCPLGVRQEFIEHATEKLGIGIRFIQTTAEIEGPGIYLTNYESVREGKIDVSLFTAVSLDEAAILRGFGGSKTFREAMRMFEGTPYRFVATATPSPNEYIELLAYAAFLGIMDVGEAKTRFFKRNSEKADELTLHPHKEEEFWLWVNSWAVFLQKPSDLGFSDEGYELPPMSVEWIEVECEETALVEERDGRVKLFAGDALGIQGAAAAKRASLPARIAAVQALLEASPDDHAIIWHDLEDERRALEACIPGIVTVYGTQDLEEREQIIVDFKEGRLARVGAKPVMFGAGGNLQYHCAWAVFAGVGFKFNDFIQALHRIYRFLQTRPVRITILHSAAERPVAKNLQAKWERYDEQMARMSALLREYGLNSIESHEALTRSIGTERHEAAGARWTAVLNDTVEETMAMADNSVDGMVLTSIPFETQYEYTPSYNDFGHTDDAAHFWQQMDFLTPELLRVMAPGRVLAVHVKDRVRPGGMDGISFQTVNPFHAHGILHFQRHGFAYMAMITVATDVVRENNQTNRLGWMRQCQDGSRMSVGIPEYVLLFRKLPTDLTAGWADVRVVKSQADYSRARWQMDAHAIWRSSGNRLLTGEDLVSLPAKEIFRQFRNWSATHVYDHEAVVRVAETLDAAKRLPPGFMLLQPPSTVDDVWTDVTRMRTLNSSQVRKGQEVHLCPLQFDIVDRLVNRFTNPGEIVFDPFGGLMTVPLRATRLGRRGLGVELNPTYFADGVGYLRAAEEKQSLPTLFDVMETEEVEDEEEALAAP